MSRDHLRERLTEFYQKHSPEKITSIDRIYNLVCYQPLCVVHELLLRKYNASVWTTEEILEDDWVTV